MAHTTTTHTLTVTACPNHYKWATKFYGTFTNVARVSIADECDICTCIEILKEDGADDPYDPDAIFDCIKEVNDDEPLPTLCGKHVARLADFQRSQLSYELAIDELDCLACSFELLIDQAGKAGSPIRHERALDLFERMVR